MGRRRLRYMIGQEGPAFLLILLGIVFVVWISSIFSSSKSSFGSKNPLETYLNGAISKQIEKAKIQYKNSNGKI